VPKQESHLAAKDAAMNRCAIIGQLLRPVSNCLGWVLDETDMDGYQQLIANLC
jgi:hypothetical protein